MNHTRKEKILKITKSTSEVNRKGGYELEVAVFYYFTGPGKLIDGKRRKFGK